MSEFNQETYASGEAVPYGTVLEKVWDPSYQRWRRKQDLRIIFDDGIEETLLKWSEVGALGNAAVSRDTTKANAGLASLKLTTRTSGQALDDYVRAERKSAFLGQKRVRFRCTWNFDDASKNKMMIFTLLYFDHSKANKASVRYDVPNHKWQYLDSTNTWNDVTATSGLYYASGVFLWFEIEVDFVGMKILRFLAPGAAKTLNTDLYRSDDATTRDYLSCQVETTTQGAATATAFYDDFRLEEIGD